MRKMLHYLIIVTCSAMLFTSCSEPEKEVYFGPLLGVWEEIVEFADRNDPKYAGNCEGADAGFSGTFQFNKSGKFRFDGGFGTIAGPIFGFLEGTFIVQSDSLLILNSTDYDVQSIYLILDTLYLEVLTDTLFIEHARASCLRYWKKVE